MKSIVEDEVMVRTSKEWTSEEDAIIAEHYPKGGSSLCKEHLPHRSVSSIEQHAHKLKVYFRGRRTVEDEPPFQQTEGGYLRDRWLEAERLVREAMDVRARAQRAYLLFVSRHARDPVHQRRVA